MITVNGQHQRRGLGSVPQQPMKAIKELANPPAESERRALRGQIVADASKCGWSANRTPVAVVVIFSVAAQPIFNP